MDVVIVKAVIDLESSIFPFLYYSKNTQDFPGGAVVKNLPANAGDTCLSPVQEDPHATEQLIPLATTTEAHEPRSPYSAIREATAMRSPRTAMKSSPCSPQLEKACAAMKTQRSQK